MSVRAARAGKDFVINVRGFFLFSIFFGVRFSVHSLIVVTAPAFSLFLWVDP